MVLMKQAASEDMDKGRMIKKSLQILLLAQRSSRDISRFKLLFQAIAYDVVRPKGEYV